MEMALKTRTRAHARTLGIATATSTPLPLPFSWPDKVDDELKIMRVPFISFIALLALLINCLLRKEFTLNSASDSSLKQMTMCADMEV